MPQRPVHFEIQVDNVDRAIQFYTAVFGWSFQRWEQNDYWMIMTADKDSTEPGINGGLLPRPAELAKPQPKTAANAFVCTMVVDSFDDAAKKIEAAGGRMVVPKTDLAGMAWQGYFLDTEGNVFGVHEVKKNAQVTK